MNTGNALQASAQRPVTIRFPHIDAAGIMFYPRYFEILSQTFPEVSIATPPFAFRTEFKAPNRLGDALCILYEAQGLQGGWSFSGRMQKTLHFAIRSLPGAVQPGPHAHAPGIAAYRAPPLSMGAWATDYTGFLQISRFFELVNLAVEQWFADELGMSFRDMHMSHHMGIPTVQMTTWGRGLPKIGDPVTMWIRPTRIGRRSLTYTTWLVSGGECLLRNEQVVVFIKRSNEGVETIAIPADIRARLEAGLGSNGREAV